MPEREQSAWGELLREAVEKPGRILSGGEVGAVHGVSAPVFWLNEVVSAEGIEPSTYGLRVHCSAS